VMSYRSSVSQWLQMLFQGQQQQQQQQHVLRTPWNAFMRQLFRFFAGLAELQVATITRCCHRHSVYISNRAKHGSLTATDGEFCCGTLFCPNSLDCFNFVFNSNCTHQLPPPQLPPSPLQPSSSLPLLHHQPFVCLQCAPSGWCAVHGCCWVCFG
jgi:hypothetical protein